MRNDGVIRWRPSRSFPISFNTSCSPSIVTDNGVGRHLERERSFSDVSDASGHTGFFSSAKFLRDFPLPVCGSVVPDYSLWPPPTAPAGCNCLLAD